MRPCIVAFATALAWLVGNPAAIQADADEASVHAGLTIAGATAAAQALGPAELMLAGGMSGRFTYATSDWYAYEATVELEHSAGLASFIGASDDRAADDPDANQSGRFVRHMGWLRSEAGISARLGVRWIPTFYAGLGVQMQRVGEARDVCLRAVLPGPGRKLTLEMVGAVGAGVDYRVDEHWVMGVSLRVRRSAPWVGDEAYGAIGLALHIGYYWYPGNMAGTGLGEKDKGQRR
jgi:hypothetical protein